MAHTATKNTSTTISTTGMHTDVLHILNNDHTFGITERGGGGGIGTTNNIQRWILGKTVKKQTEQGTGCKNAMNAI